MGGEGEEEALFLPWHVGMTMTMTWAGVYSLIDDATHTHKSTFLLHLALSEQHNSIILLYIKGAQDENIFVKPTVCKCSKEARTIVTMQG